MEWQKSEIGQIWHWSGSSSRKVVIHFNFHSSRYDVAFIRGMLDGGAGVSAQGFRNLKEAQEWARLMM